MLKLMGKKIFSNFCSKLHGNQLLCGIGALFFLVKFIKMVKDIRNVVCWNIAHSSLNQQNCLRELIIQNNCMIA